MEITESRLALASRHQTVARQERRETLTMWHDAPRPEPADTPRFSKGARALQPAPARLPAGARGGLDSAHDLEIEILRLIVERMTGRKIQLVDPAEVQAPPDTATPAAPPSASAPAPEAAGWGLVYDHYESRYEREDTAFRAEGVVRTRDGREIAIEVALNMSREFFTEERLQVRAGDALKDPLVVNFGGNAARLERDRFEFDLDLDGRRDQVTFLAPGSGFLTLDRNGDGRVNDGGELFGPRSGDGFAELAELDDDGNGWVDGGDAAFERLRLWSRTADGETRLAGLGAHGIGAIYLGHIDTPFLLKDEANATLGRVSAGGLFLGEDGDAGSVQRVDLAV